jgi:ribosomal protein L37E
MFHLPAMTLLIDTLGRAARYRMLVVAKCRHCGRQAHFYAEELAAHYGRGRDPRTLKFRCQSCKASNCRITVTEQHFERHHEMIVWRPVKVKRPL